MIIICASVLLALFVIFAIYYFLRRHNEEPSIMEGSEFEDYCAHLLEINGFEHITQTPASRDFGCDILARKDGVSYGIQCKSYSSPVGVSAVAQAYAGKDYYDCHIGVVMTNSTYTSPAKDMADKLKVLLWDGEVLEIMSQE